MLACRSLLRLDQALRVATTRAALNRLGGNSQGHCSYHVFSYARRKNCKSCTESVMNKKRQSANLVWRAVSTQPASSGESEFVDHVVEVENVLEQTAVLDNLTTLVEAVADLCPTATAHGDRIEVLEDTGMNHATSSSAAFQDNNELMDAEEVLADGITTSLPLNSTGNGGTGDAIGASISPGSHSASLTVGASVMRFIRKKREFIEEETGVYLIFPSSKEEQSIAACFSVYVRGLEYILLDMLNNCLDQMRSPATACKIFWAALSVLGLFCRQQVSWNALLRRLV